MTAPTDPPRAVVAGAPDGHLVPEAERAFYVEEFASSTIVASLVSFAPETEAAVARAAASLASGGGRLVVVTDAEVASVAGLDVPTLLAPATMPGEAWMAGLWLAATDHPLVVARCAPGQTASVASSLAVGLGARKLVVTDPGGGWGRPPRSFADVVTHADAFRHQLADRQGGAVVEAITVALDGGVTNVNICRPEDLDRELFTFDGTGTLFTSGGYVELGPLRVDDLPAVERLVAQGIADGLLRARSREEIAALAVTGMGARVVGSGHLAGIVSLEVDRYCDEGVGEVSCLYTVSRFSGAGAGAVLVEGLVARALELQLRSLFAITVSDAAATFFERRGFAEVGLDLVPAAKWQGYDPARRAQARAFVRDVHGEHLQASLGF